MKHSRCRSATASAVACSLAAIWGCQEQTNTNGTLSGEAFVGGLPSQPVGPCNAVVQQQAIEGWAHVPICTKTDYQSNPPSSGDHYPIWAAYKTYTSPIPEGYWVHNLEHGGVVLTYNCPGGCADDVAAAGAWIKSQPDDTTCPVDEDAGEIPVRVRFVMTPDPKLTAKFAASAWGWTLRADCFDPVAFSAFKEAHYGNGRELMCGDGDDVSNALAAQPGCGE